MDERDLREEDQAAMMKWQDQMRSLIHQHNKALCDTCLAILWQSLDPMRRGINRGGKTYVLASSARALRDSMRWTNCCFCDLISASLAMAEDASSDHERDDETRSISLRSIVGDSNDAFDAHIFGWSVQPNPPTLPRPKQIRLFTKDDDILSHSIPGRSVDPKGSGPDSLRLAAEWIDDCYSNHDCCQLGNNISEDPPFPTRVIDIGLSDSNLVRLLVSNGIKGKWAALSYRWGDVPKASKGTGSATMANLESLQDEIPSNLLSATFLDAIQITRSLGLRYIWIDRLCILQDSDSDWAKEAAHMPLIYQNAHVTIAAGASVDGASGIFGNRKWAESSRPVDLPVLCTEGISRISIDFDIDLFQSSLESNSLTSRAWCFQEAQLSRRRLIFDREQTSFVCLKHGLQEKWASKEKYSPFYGDLLNERPRIYSPSRTRVNFLEKEKQRDLGLVAEDQNHFLYRFFLLKSPTRTLARKGDMLETWYDMLTDYSGRDLTFATDRLVAIAGVAEPVGQVLKDDYVAGMWKSSLPESLLWSPHIKNSKLEVDAYNKCSRFDTYTAPSWSWAAVCGRIWFSLCKRITWDGGPKTPVTVLDVFTDAVSSEPYGTINTGSLLIQGPLKRGRVSHVKAKDGERHRWPRISFPEKFDTEVHCILDISSEHHQGNTEQLWCFQITDREGLLLVQLSESEQRYSRVGIFTTGIGQHVKKLKYVKKRHPDHHYCLRRMISLIVAFYSWIEASDVTRDLTFCTIQSLQFSLLTLL